MSKINKYLLVSFLIAIGLCMVAIKFYMQSTNYAEYTGSKLYWSGETYVHYSGGYLASEGALLGKTKDGWSIYEADSDATHTFVVIRNFLDQYLMVKEDYSIPERGRVSVAFWDHLRIDDESFVSVIYDILENATADFQYETSNVFVLNGNQKMRELYVGFDNCPVPINFLGYMGTVDGNWYITTNDSFEHNLNGEQQTIYCYSIPLKYTSILEQYFS